MKGFAPKKRFSQNFLTDPRIADKIVASLNIQPNDCILEIGPGTGMLTSRLVATDAARIVAVDVDPRAITHIKIQPWCSAAGNRFDIRLQDALQIDVKNEFPGVDVKNVKVIGNIPYGITSDILFWMFGQCENVDSAVIMMQREVAQRCVASIKTKEYGNLAVATALVSKAHIEFNVKPGSFHPVPDVTSSVVHFDFLETSRGQYSLDDTMKFVRQAFSQRRKVLTNALKGSKYMPNDHVVSGMDLSKMRAEELTVDQLLTVYSYILSMGSNAMPATDVLDVKGTS